MSPRVNAGRHEHGQNFLIDPSVVAAMVAGVAGTTGPVLEIGGGDGALTAGLAALGRALCVVELDVRWVRRMRRTLPAHVEVVHGDYLRAAHPRGPHAVVGNLPFHLTTAILRRLLAQPEWTDAVVLVQWEVARRRAGVGGASLMTAQWWPWFEFALLRRVPARAFAPVPSVDGGLLRITRRPDPAVRDRPGYQRFVHRVFTGAGHGLPEILRRAGVPPRASAAWLRACGLNARHLPKDLRRQDWEDLWTLRSSSSQGRRHLAEIVCSSQAQPHLRR